VALVPGGRLGHFEILAPLGAGHGCRLPRPRHRGWGCDVALKVLPEAFAVTPAGSPDSSAKHASSPRCSHPAIAAIHGLEPGRGRPRASSWNW